MRTKLIVAGCGLLALACAQNQEQPVTQTQNTRGPETPSAVTINVTVAGGHGAGKGNVTTTQPWSTGGTPVPHLLARAAGGKADAAKGSASGEPTAGGNVIIAPLWIDASTLTEAKSGGMSPRTGTINPSLSGEQKPETQVNPAVPISIGAQPNASASTTSSFKAPATSGQQTFDQSGARTFLKAIGLQDSQIEQVMKLLAGSLTSQPAG